MNEQFHIEQGHISQRVHELLNGSIDGELNTAEQGELDRLLADSDKVRGLNEELIELTCLLDDLPEREPPEHLQDAIERLVRLPVRSSSRDGKPGFFGSWLPAYWLRTGFALAAAAVLTVGVYEMGSEPITARDAANIAGTVARNPATVQGELLDSIVIDTDTLNGRVELRNRDDLFTLDVQLNWDGPTEVVVNLAGRGLEFEGITQQQDRKDAVSVVDGSISVVSSGAQQYALNLRRTSEATRAEPLTLEFFANNMLVHEAELNVSQQ